MVDKLPEIIGVIFLGVMLVIKAIDKYRWFTDPKYRLRDGGIRGNKDWRWREDKDVWRLWFWKGF